MKSYILLILILVFAFLIYSYNIIQPFLYLEESMTTVYGVPAKNFLKYGLIKTKFAPLCVSGPIEYYDNVNEHYRVRHPFLSSFAIYLSFSIFGVHEWSLRLVFIIFALAGVILFYLLARRLLGKIVNLFLPPLSLLLIQCMHICLSFHLSIY